MNEIWWGRVPNALAYIDDITNSLRNEKSLILQYRHGIPWRDSMVFQIRESIKQSNASKRIEDVRNCDSPGQYLLDTYCKQEKRALYRPTKTHAKFFAESDDIVLHSIFFWVVIQSTDQLEAWTSFISEYTRERGKKEKAAFVLEWNGDNIVTAKKGIRVYVFDEYINEYDRMVFSALASSTIKEDTIIKNYLSELAAMIAENDIEICAECLAKHQYAAFLNDPASVIRELCPDDTRSETEITHTIWRAQIKTIYPLLEEYREEFVEKYASAIEPNLPIETAYGEQYEDPEDVELGTLVFMADNRMIVISSPDYFRLKKYKEARNKLSHLDTLTIDEIRSLLQ